MSRALVASLVVATALAATLFATSCSSGPAASPPTTTGATTTEASSTVASAAAPATNATDPTTVVAQSSDSKMTAAQATEIALKTIPGGTVLEIDPGFESGHAVWEVLVRKSDGSGVELYIQSSTGAILKQKPALVPAEAKGSSPAVTIQQASDTAVAAVPGGRLVEIDLGTSSGRTVWEALVAGADGRTEIYIDAATGKIIKQERAD